MHTVIPAAISASYPLRRLFWRSGLVLLLCLPLFACSRTSDEAQKNKTDNSVWSSQIHVLEQAKAVRDKINAHEAAQQQRQNAILHEIRP